MHVVMITQSYYPRIGGIETLLTETIPLMQQKGMTVDIITRQYKGFKAFEIKDGIRIFRMPTPPPKVLASLTFTIFALRIIKQLKPDVIHAHDVLSPSTTAILAKRLYKTPVVLTIHLSGPNGDLLGLPKSFLGPSRLNAIRKKIDAYIAISQEIYQEMLHAGLSETKLRYMPNGINTERFKPVDNNEKINLRKTLNLPEKAIIAVYTGRLVPQKCVNVLVSIWDSIINVHPEAILLIVGGGPEETKLKSMAGNGVVFIDTTYDVAPYLKASDIFVLPSSQEGLSVALLEALSCGLPAVVTDINGNAELVKDNINGFTVPPGSSDSLKQAVLHLIENPTLRKSCGENARKNILEKHSINDLVNQLSNIYQSVQLETK